MHINNYERKDNVQKKGAVIYDLDEAFQTKVLFVFFAVARVS